MKTLLRHAMKSFGLSMGSFVLTFASLYLACFVPFIPVQVLGTLGVFFFLLTFVVFMFEFVRDALQIQIYVEQEAKKEKNHG